MTSRLLSPRSVSLVAVCWLLAGGPVPAAEAIEPPPVVFEGLGLAGFEGAGSVAAALRASGAAAATPASEPRPLEIRGIAVSGPTGRQAAPGPLAAELRSRIDRFDVSAGLLADPAATVWGPSVWTGRVGLANDRAGGRESFEVRTIVAPGQERSLIGLAVGPRVERRIGLGITLFIDGQAEAQAVRPTVAGWWSLRGTSADDLTMLGLSARTGLLR